MTPAGPAGNSQGGTFGTSGSLTLRMPMRNALRAIHLIVATFVSVTPASAVLAQSAGIDRVPEQGEGEGAACPPMSKAKRRR